MTPYLCERRNDPSTDKAGCPRDQHACICKTLNPSLYDIDDVMKILIRKTSESDLHRTRRSDPRVDTFRTLCSDSIMKSIIGSVSPGHTPIQNAERMIVSELDRSPTVR